MIKSSIKHDKINQLNMIKLIIKHDKTINKLNSLEYPYDLAASENEMI